MAAQFCGCQTCEAERRPLPGGAMRPVHDENCLIWDDSDVLRCDCYWENCLDNTHKPWCAVLAGDWVTGCSCVDAWRLEARVEGYAEISWPIEGAEILEKAQNVTINGFNLKIPKDGTFPEQYDVFREDGVPVAYLRLRDGGFTVEVPERGGKFVYGARIAGEGRRGPSMFEAADRRRYLTEAVEAIDREIRVTAITAKLSRV